MNEYVDIVVLVEGPTEQKFIKEILAPYLVRKSIFMTPIVISKSGQKGGDIRFERVKNDIGLHLKQRQDTFLTLFVDFYGTKADWPGLAEAKGQASAQKKAEFFNLATKEKIDDLYRNFQTDRRFIPYVSMHEFEALLFCQPEILAKQLSIKLSAIEKILTECGVPEEINDSYDTAPSRRLEKLYKGFKKTTNGIMIAKEIGIDGMRQACSLFDAWLLTIENLRDETHG